MTGKPPLALRDTNRRAQCHSNVLPRLNGQAKSHKAWRLPQGCWGWVLPFPVDGGHPRSSHRHRDPSCKERHREVTAPGVTGGSSCHYRELPAATSCSQHHDWDRRALHFPTHQDGPSLLGYRCRVCTVPLGQIPVDKMFDFYLTSGFSHIPVPVTWLNRG